MLKITLPSAGDGSLNEYGYVLLMALWIAFQCYMYGFFIVEYRRIKTFPTKYLEQNFREEHMKAFPQDTRVPKFGYPDMGCGYYSSKLTYKQWFEMNIAQRIHGNFLEQVLIVVFLILVAGLKHPAFTVYLGLAYSIGRILNAIGYTIQRLQQIEYQIISEFIISVQYRLPGNLILNIALSLLFGLSAHSMISLL